MGINTDVVTNTLDLFSFMLATPEVIGQERAEKIGDELRRLLAFVSPRAALVRVARCGAWLRKYLWQFFFGVLVLALFVDALQHIRPEPLIYIVAGIPVIVLFLIEIALLLLMPISLVLRMGILIETIVNRSRMSRILFIIGVLMFFCSRMLAIVHAFNHGA